MSSDEVPGGPPPPATEPPRNGGGADQPERIGPYRVVSVLGEGGMGVVYLAEQTEPVRRFVALKILKPGMDTRQVVARFESERQSLAVMEHPGIAKVYDAGATETGRPYFVMERVDGVPLTDYCDVRRLGVRERVRLFLQVCRAVQHAHQKGVIHRDLKPSNVLVAGDGADALCKIIDFGIARATEQSAEERTRLTQHEQSLGTPAYMSPEQAIGSGLDVDTRTDVYSLGVLLYELLAGVLPFEPQAYRGWAFVAHHMTKDPPLPSARFAGLRFGDRERLAELRGAAPDAVRRALRGDLDWIVMRALEKERERRYETANGFALDLERYLGNLPVLASPPSRAYAARKFVRRHRIGVAFGAVLAVLLVAFAASMAVQADRVARARDLAVARQGQAEDLIGFMLGDLWGKLEPLGRLEILDDAGDRAVAYFAQVPAEELSDQELSSRARMLYSIGRVRMRQGSLPEAVRAFEESLRLARELSQRAPADPQRQYELGQSEFWVGYAAWRAGDLGAAEVAFREYLGASERLVAIAPDVPEYQLEVAYAYSNLGSIHEQRGDLELAVDAYSRTLGVKSDLVAGDSSNVDWLGELAETHNTLGVAYRKLGRYEEALTEHEREHALKLLALARSPDHAYWRERLVMTHHYVGALLLATGRAEEALERYRLGAAMADSLVAHDPANADWRRAAAVMRRQVGIALAVAGRRADALAAFDAARTALAELVRRDSTVVAFQRELMQTHTAAARALLDFGRPAEALAEADRGWELAERTAASSRVAQQAVAGSRITRAHALAALGDAAQAAAAYQHAATDLLPLSTGHEGTEFQALLIEAYLGLNRGDDARRLLGDLVASGYREYYLTRFARAAGIHPEH